MADPQWLDSSVWARVGRGRSWTFALPTRDVIDALGALAASQNDQLVLLQCSRRTVDGESRSIFVPQSVQDLSPAGPWQYFIQSHRLTPALPAPQHLAGV